MRDEKEARERREELFRLLAESEDTEALAATLIRRMVARAEAEEPEWGALLRAAAVPRLLDEGLMGVLRGAPDDADGNRAALRRLAGYSFVLPDPEGRSYALHEEVRTVLLEDWQAPERRTRYVELSRALGAYFREQDPLEALYHRFAFDPAGALAEFEQQFWDAHRFYRRAECGALLADLSPLPTKGEGPGVRVRLRTWTLHGLGLALDSQGKWAEAVEVYQEALKGWRELDDRYGEGQTLGNLGNVYYSQGRWAEAIRMYEESLRIKRELGDRRGEAHVLHNLGRWHKGQGQLDEALAHYEEALAIRRELAAWPQAGGTLHALAEVYALCGDWARAADMAGQAAEAWRRATEGNSAQPSFDIRR